MWYRDCPRPSKFWSAVSNAYDGTLHEVWCSWKDNTENAVGPSSINLASKAVNAEIGFEDETAPTIEQKRNGVTQMSMLRPKTSNKTSHEGILTISRWWRAKSKGVYEKKRTLQNGVKQCGLRYTLYSSSTVEKILFAQNTLSNYTPSTLLMKPM